MPPKRNLKNNNNTPNNPRKGRPRIVKPNPTSPNDIKIEVPVKKSSKTTRRVTRKGTLNDQQKIANANEETPRKVAKTPIFYYEQKIALANEVVRYQFNKKPRIFDFDKEIPTVEIINDKEKPKYVVSKKSRAQNGVDGKATSEKSILDCKVNENQKQKVTKKNKSDTNIVTKKALTRKRTADSTQETETCVEVKKNIIEPKRRRINRNVKVQRVHHKEIIEGKDNVTEELKNKHQMAAPTVINGAQYPNSKCAGRIDSRKTSSASTSCMSWTKDLSSSSITSVAATCNDFIRIDNKLPILKLTNIDSKIINENDERADNNEYISAVDSDSSDSAKSKQSHHLNLSTSSITTLSSINTKNHQNNTLKGELNKAFNKLTSKLKHFDVEIINWIGYGKENSDVSMKGFQDKIIIALKEECEIITHCQNLKRILSKNDDLKPPEKDPDEIVVETHIENVDVSSRNVPENGSKDKNTSAHQVVQNAVAEVECNDNDNVKLKNNENYDDEDAISIYAESITGIESEKLSNSITPASKDLDYTEYIPEPMKKPETEPKRYTYCPTKISENNQLIVKRTVCEKQNADSTSIFKDTVCEPASEGEIDSVSSECNRDNLNNNFTKIAEPQAAIINTEPVVSNGVRNSEGQICGIFKNICKFNLFNRCKNSWCRFSHVVPDVLEIKHKLHALNDEAFISEYIALRKVYAICRKYGICFVEECCNRDIVRVLVEMAKHFFVNAKIKCKDDSVYIREILECVLLRLNIVNLNICEDLLIDSVTPTMLLCDVFMQTIAETQNFSRFKVVFLNLTHFIVSHGGKFHLFVAEHVLERVCILPPEKPLCRALLDIIKNTDRAIFRNNMVGKFENMLLLLDKKLYNDLLTIKVEAIGSLLTSPSDSNASSHYSNNNAESMMVNAVVNLGDKSYTSPDTTDVNSLKNKFFEAIPLTRTVNFNKSYFKEPVKNNPPNDKVENWQKADNCKQFGQQSPHVFSPPFLTLPVARPVVVQNKNKRQVAYRPMVTVCTF